MIHNILFGALFGGALCASYVHLVRKRYKHTLTLAVRSPFNEDILKLPGHSARIHRAELLDSLAEKYDQFLVWSVLLVLTALLPSPILVMFAALPCIFGVFYVLYQSSRIGDEVNQAILKCDGEEYTGQELNFLWQFGASVFHDLPYDGGNIDHIVVSANKVIVVETFTINKVIQNDDQRNQSDTSVTFDGGSLKFPHMTTTEPVEKVKQHANVLAKQIKDACGFDYPVIPVIAIPGWHVNVAADAGTDLLVINPKRAHGLKKWLGEKTASKHGDKVLRYISSIARSHPAKSHRTDSGAGDEYEFWLSPRYKDKILRD